MRIIVERLRSGDQEFKLILRNRRQKR
jgi:hypothetical protein